MGWGGGGMLTFLVVRTLHVATLQRSGVVATVYTRRGGVGSKSKDLLLHVKCCQWRCVNLHARPQQKNISRLKRLL